MFVPCFQVYSLETLAKTVLLGKHTQLQCSTNAWRSLLAKSTEWTMTSEVNLSQLCRVIAQSIYRTVVLPTVGKHSLQLQRTDLSISSRTKLPIQLPHTITYAQIQINAKYIITKQCMNDTSPSHCSLWVNQTVGSSHMHIRCHYRTAGQIRDHMHDLWSHQSSPPNPHRSHRCTDRTQR